MVRQVWEPRTESGHAKQPGSRAAGQMYGHAHTPVVATVAIAAAVVAVAVVAVAVAVPADAWGAAGGTGGSNDWMASHTLGPDWQPQAHATQHAPLGGWLSTLRWVVG